MFLARHFPECSRRTVQRAIHAGAVRINGRRARKGDFVDSNDVVEIGDQLLAPPALQPNPDLVLDILYEDALLIAVDKPPGMPSYALRADETDTVANFLLARHPAMAQAGRIDREAGIVHRLDTDTSGILLAARTPDAYASLRRQFTAGQVLKEYVALVEGQVEAPGVVRTALTHQGHKRRVMRPATRRRDRRGRVAVTEFEPIERFRRGTLLRVRIRTGVRHQIRAHLASLGHPVVGDRLYGSAARDSARHLLHAVRLRITHPQSAEMLEIRSTPCADFEAVLQRWRSGN